MGDEQDPRIRFIPARVLELLDGAVALDRMLVQSHDGQWTVEADVDGGLVAATEITPNRRAVVFLDPDVSAGWGWSVRVDHAHIGGGVAGLLDEAVAVVDTCLRSVARR